MSNVRKQILSLLNGQESSSPPTFSGLIHVTTEGLRGEGFSLSDVHHDSKKMARAAASTFRLTGMPSATLPLDLCAPAEALGAKLNYYEGIEDRFPQPSKALFASAKYLNNAYFQNADFIHKGRLPVVCDAIRLLKEDVGDDVVISGIIPGPYTLLLYLVEPGGMFAEMKREPNSVLDALILLSSFLSEIGNAYRSAGADFITVHEMGGSPGFIGPAKFEQFVLPALKELHAKLPRPRVLSVCGNTNKSVQLLSSASAEAISVDQLNDLKSSRNLLQGVLLFGNIDPVQTLWQGDDAQIADAIRRAKDAGVDAIWPGCDLVLQTPIENIRALV